VRDVGLFSLAVIAIVIASWRMNSSRDRPREMVGPGYMP